MRAEEAEDSSCPDSGGTCGIKVTPRTADNDGKMDLRIPGCGGSYPSLVTWEKRLQVDGVGEVIELHLDRVEVSLNQTNRSTYTS